MPVTATAFSPDGRLVASYSLEENVVRFWQASGGGFFNSLIGALGPSLSYSSHSLSNHNNGNIGFETSRPSSTVMMGQMRLFRTFVLGKRLESIPTLMEIVHNTKFEWMSNRCAMLKGPNNLEMFFNV